LAFAIVSVGFAPTPFKDGTRREFVEKFTRTSKDATAGYGKFSYEATARGYKADVSGGRLRLTGDHEEGDQRLVVPAMKAAGKKQWPDELEVSAKLGGTAADSGAWHVGLSVGSVKVLFHPDYPEGAFRAETVDGHVEIFGNQDMGFTPASGVMHKVTVKVRRMGPNYRFEVEVVNGKGKGTYRKSFTATAKQMGKFDRVGLERSGRRGGDALFESLSIKWAK
jgi:hypothetical protein